MSVFSTYVRADGNRRGNGVGQRVGMVRPLGIVPSTLFANGMSWNTSGPAKRWGGGIIDLTTHAYLTFTLLGDSTLWATEQENWASVSATNDVAPIAWSDTHHDLPIRVPLTPPPPPPFHGTVVVPSGVAARALSLWNSGLGTNNPDPTGWETPGFADGGWGAAVIPGCAPPSPNAGSQIWAEEPPKDVFEIILIRQHFTAPPGSPSTVTIIADGFFIVNIFLNGHTFGVTGGIPQILAPGAAGWVNPGGDNVIALEVGGVSGSSAVCKYVAYALTYTYI